MGRAVRVARVDEIPPGEGKTVELPSCTVTVYNAEGRYFARVESRLHRGGDEARAPGCSPSCLPPGRHFSVTVEDSPAHGFREPRPMVPRVQGEYVVVVLDEAA